MSYFEGQTPRWSQQGPPQGPQHNRQQSWDPAGPGPQSHGQLQYGAPDPLRASSSHAQSDSPSSQISPNDNAFGTQFEEVARASENLSKNSPVYGMHGRRESMPMPGNFSRQFPDYGAGKPLHKQNNRSVGGPRGLTQPMDPRMAKRRAAAQRERELRNYHQEQQYNRNSSSAKNDRSMSPGGMSEEDRRELIARQHRALYGNDSNLYIGDGSSSRPLSQDARVMAAETSVHGSSPLGPYEQFGGPPPHGSSAPEGPMPINSAIGGQSRSRENSNSSPAPNTGSFAMYDSQQAPRPNSSTSPGGSPTRSGVKGPTSGGGVGGVAPIGTRPLSGAKRNTPPMPSPLGYGAGNAGQAHAGERSHSAQSNSANTNVSEKPSNLGGWSGSGGPWGNNKVQAPVWG